MPDRDVKYRCRDLPEPKRKYKHSMITDLEWSPSCRHLALKVGSMYHRRLDESQRPAEVAGVNAHACVVQWRKLRHPGRRLRQEQAKSCSGHPALVSLTAIACMLCKTEMVWVLCTLDEM